MFDTLSKGFRNARNRLQGLTELTEETLDPALRDVRLSLLEADVEFNVTKRFLANVREKLVGQTVEAKAKVDRKGQALKIGPSERFIKACQDELVAMMVAEGPPLHYATKPSLTTIMMVGLQGAGKTTTAGKLARLLESEGRKVLLVAADLQRPGAVEQLRVLGEKINVPVFSEAGISPVEVCRRGLEHGRKLKRDTVIFDTAGRLAIDEPLMEELSAIKKDIEADNVLMVIDAMIGQDAVKTAASFHERLALTGVVMTKLDGDARGGAALSVREVTGAPVRFVGMGEGMDKLEAFRPDGMASRILGFGDVVGLMKDFEQVVDQEKAERDAKRMLQGRFTLNDFLEQVRMIQQMGPLQDIFEKLPFFKDSVPEGFQVPDGELKKVEAIVSSMTPQERAEPELFQKQRSRIERVARGSGRKANDVAELLQRFQFMRQMMGGLGQQANMFSRIPGMKQMAMARQLKNNLSFQGLEGNPMMSSLASELFEAAVAEGGGGAKSAMPRKIDKEKKKLQRKAEKKARQKNRR